MIRGGDELRALLDQGYREEDNPSPAPRAAVAAVFRAGADADDPELLFIQRASKPSDPWSGQMAFPGGRKEQTDASPRATATRETGEEVGLDLTPARYAGALSELDGGRANGRHIIVSAHGFWLPGPRPQLSPNHEVADALWVPLSVLTDRERYIEYHYPPAAMDFPGIQLDRDDQVIWGLTLRLLSDLFARLQQPFIIEYQG